MPARLARLIQGLLLGVTVAGLGAAAARAGEGAFLKIPYIQNVTPHSAVVMWETEKPVDYLLTWLVDGKELGRRSGRTAAKVGEIAIGPLPAATAIDYSVTVDTSSLGGRFRTYPAGDAAIRFCVYSDSQDTWPDGPDRHRKFAGMIARRSPLLILHCGDLLDRGGDYKSWNTAHFGPLKGLAPSVPIYPAIGNHEYAGGTRLYEQFHSLPNNEHWYSFDCGSVHFISLDSNVYRNADVRSEEAEQRAWLEADLKACKAPWKVVYFHQPVYNDGAFGSPVGLKAFLVPVLERHGVNLVFTGHEHRYARTMPVKNGKRDPAGITYFITGINNGGDSADQFTFTAASGASCYACVDADASTLSAVIYGEEDQEIDRVVLTRSDAYLKDAVKRAGSKDDSARLEAVNDLAALNDGTTGDALRKIAADSDGEIARRARAALVRTGQVSTEELLAALDDRTLTVPTTRPRSSTPVSAIALCRLYERPADEQMKAAQTLLGRPDGPHRQWGIQLLANVASADAVARLETLSVDPSPATRAGVARVLGRIFDPYSDKIGLDMGRISFLRKYIEEFPGRVANPEKIYAMLLRLADDQEKTVRAAAQESLLNMAGHHQLLIPAAGECVTRVVAIAEHSADAALRLKAVRSLPALPVSVRIDELLVRLLDNADKDVAMRAVGALHELDDEYEHPLPAAIAPLERNQARFNWFSKHEAIDLAKHLKERDGAQGKAG